MKKYTYIEVTNAIIRYNKDNNEIYVPTLSAETSKYKKVRAIQTGEEVKIEWMESYMGMMMEEPEWNKKSIKVEKKYF